MCMVISKFWSNPLGETTGRWEAQNYTSFPNIVIQRILKVVSLKRLLLGDRAVLGFEMSRKGGTRIKTTLFLEIVMQHIQSNDM